MSLYISLHFTTSLYVSISLYIALHLCTSLYISLEFQFEFESVSSTLDVRFLFDLVDSVRAWTLLQRLSAEASNSEDELLVSVTELLKRRRPVDEAVLRRCQQLATTKSPLLTQDQVALHLALAWSQYHQQSFAEWCVPRFLFFYWVLLGFTGLYRAFYVLLLVFS